MPRIALNAVHRNDDADPFGYLNSFVLEVLIGLATKNAARHEAHGLLTEADEDNTICLMNY